MSLYRKSATELADDLANGNTSSTAIVEALNARRRDVDGKLNAFVWVNESAIADARRLDLEREEGKLRGPLHGIPVSIKENINIAGTDSTLGLRARVGQPARHDAVLVKTLRDAGAIILGKTNVPQLLLAQESDNEIYGVTNNPWNIGRTPGGSSGGEASAVAAGLSPIGIGTDIGGSIRIPAHFTGIVGLKPTVDRWSNRGVEGALKGQELVRAQIGPLTRTVGDAVMLWKALDPQTMAPLDAYVTDMPPRDPDAVDVSKLRIGYFDGDSFLEPVGSLRRAVGRAREVLEAAGAAVVRHRPIPTDEIIFLWLSALTADGGDTIDELLRGEAVSPQLKTSRQMMNLPGAARRAAARLASLAGEKRLSRLLMSLGPKSVGKLWSMTNERMIMRRREHDAWHQGQLDAVICPPHVVPALSHLESGDFTLSLGSEFRWTLLNFPAGVVPVTTHLQRDVGQMPKPTDRIEKKLAAIDDRSVGLPVGVQVVARPNCEHVALAVMGAIEAGVRADAGWPQTPINPKG